MGNMNLSGQETASQGPSEAQVESIPQASRGAEANLRLHYRECSKDPSHVNFIPVQEFCIKNLPAVFANDTHLVRYIRNVADLTVRVSAKYVSENRPATWPGTEREYPSYSEDSKEEFRTGTGWIYRLEKFPDRHDKRFTFCSCWKCLDSGEKRTHFARVIIRTAAHLVFDKLEGAHTTCHLFFDKGGTPESCSGVVALTGMSQVWSFVNLDLCEMTYVTHDLGLIRRLDELVKKCEMMKMLGRREVRDSKYTQIIIVSHPHGCSKQVSIGRLTEITSMIGETFVRYIYTTPTCRGSSGAPVIVLEKSSPWTNTWWLVAHTHSGELGEEKGLNHSAYSMDKFLARCERQK